MTSVAVSSVGWTAVMGERAAFAVLCCEEELGGLSSISVLNFRDFGDANVLADFSFDHADNLLDLRFFSSTIVVFFVLFSSMKFICF